MFNICNFIFPLVYLLLNIWSVCSDADHEDISVLIYDFSIVIEVFFAGSVINLDLNLLFLDILVSVVHFNSCGFIDFRIRVVHVVLNNACFPDIFVPTENNFQVSFFTENSLQAD